MENETIMIDGVRYYADRPTSCRGCFFWKNRKAGCSLKKENYDRLQRQYASLDASIDRLAEENAGLKKVAADYDTLCRGYGTDKVEEQVKAIREHEEEQKRQRRMQRQRRSIGAR